jgi:excinuclease ABC subunit C
MADIDRLKRKIVVAPDEPGVYLMKDASGSVVYIGKAKSIKKRLSSYLGGGLSAKTLALLSRVADIEFRLTPTESLALILEASLVRRYRPKYNISLRDDKSFPLVKITDEEFPAVYITRKRSALPGRYFGPYTNAGLLKEALKIIRREFPYRSCRKLPKKACIYYRIGLSPAPCIRRISKHAYAKTINDISLILQGRIDELVSKLSRQMYLRSARKEFEQAAKIRDQINALGSLSQSNSQGQIEGLKGLLKLKKTPQRIEAFDISNISGQEASGSMVSFYRGLPDKNNYRRFRIKTINGIDDYRMLSEVLRRRYSRVIKERLPLPDLIIIDGGKGHLLTAARQLQRLGLSIPLSSIAKKEENIYIFGKAGLIQLRSDIPALNLIRRIRDEAHRFAVSYHRLLRRKKIIGR